MSNDAQHRVATTAEALEVLLSRHSDKFSPAECNEVKQAIEALTAQQAAQPEVKPCCGDFENCNAMCVPRANHWKGIVKALQQAQEPVAWVDDDLEIHFGRTHPDFSGNNWKPLYTTPPTAQAAMLRAALAKAIERMDRARGILTNDNPRPECNWGMLDTSDLRAAPADVVAVPVDDYKETLRIVVDAAWLAAGKMCADSAKKYPAQNGFAKGWRAACEALASDMKIIPRSDYEPTKEMCLAGIEAWNNTFGTPLTRYAAVFKAMIAAAREESK